jgi:hypothetical protein
MDEVEKEEEVLQRCCCGGEQQQLDFADCHFAAQVMVSQSKMLLLSSSSLKSEQ